MSRRHYTFVLAAIGLVCAGASASAETLRCQSVNGNLNCAGSNGVSCQTVNGKKVCTSGHGDVVQSFGGRSSAEDEDSANEDIGEPSMREMLRMRHPDGRTLKLERNGSAMHLQNGSLSVDQD